MLSKLLSNIANRENTSLPEGISDKIKDGKGEKGSQQVFQSLLKALKNDQSADNKQLLRLDNSDDEAAVNEQQSAQSILERLQQQLKNGASDNGEPEASGGSLANKDTVNSERNMLPPEEQENENRKVDDALKLVNVSQQQTEGGDESKKATGQLKEELIGETISTDSEDQQNSGQLGETSDNKENQSTSEHKGQSEVKATAEPSSGNNIQPAHEQELTSASDSGEQNEGDRVRPGAAGNISEQKVEALADDEGKTSNDSNQSQKVAAPHSEKEHYYPKEETDQKVDIRKEESQQLNADPKNQSDEKRTAFLSNKMDENLQRFERIPNKRGEVAATDANNQKEQNKQQSLNETIGAKSAKTELNDRQKKVFNSFFRNDNTAGLSDKGFEMKGATAEKDRRKTKENTENIEKGVISKNRDQLLSRLGISSTENSKQVRPIDIQNISDISAGDSQISAEKQKVWDEHTAENVEADDEKENKVSSSSSSFRLSQIPVANASLRQKMLPGLTQSVQKAAAEAKKNPGNWKKHNFVLDDGKKIQLSVRESNGVLQVKMGSMNSDLSKLLQQNLQQIREHLRQEFDSDIDLQFESHDQGEEESAFSEGSKSSDQQRKYRNALSGNELAAEGTGDTASSTVRNFGYNQMEWTA